MTKLDGLKIQYKMINKLMNDIYPIPILGGGHFNTSVQSAKKQRGTRGRGKKKLINKLIKNEKELFSIVKVNSADDGQMLKNLKNHLTIDFSEFIINYHSASKQKINFSVFQIHRQD